jgi:nucleotide-binding universal stress UspA family protein
MIKDILVKLERAASRDGVVDFALSVASAHDAHITAVAFPNAYVANFLFAEVPADVLQRTQAEIEASAKGAAARFEKKAGQAACSTESILVTEEDTLPPKAFSAMARRFDLSIVMQSDSSRSAYNDPMIEAALFDSGRPVIVVPYIQKGGLTYERIVCCWDGSRAAARAINDALPLLKKARAVELFIVSNDTKEIPDRLRGAEIGRHLARHGISLEVECVPAIGISVDEVILSHVADCSANMIVMGGYGHSRFREFMLGGVTRGMLSSMTVPVFMSH